MRSMTVFVCVGCIPLVTSCMKPFQFGLGSAGVLNFKSEDMQLVKSDMIFSYGLNLILSKPR